jgi:signal transduction histidine kinase
MLTKSDGLGDRAAILMLEDRAGALWVARQAGGLDRLGANAVQHFEVDPGPLRRPVSALLETQEGVLWAATRDGQVYSLKDGSFSPAFRKLRGPGKILAMAEDAGGQIWFGGRSGLAVWDGGESQRTIDFGSPQVVTAVVSAGATMWVGTENGRVFRGTGEQFQAIAAAESFARQPISSLLPDADGSVWVGTLGGGLFRVREARVVAFAARMSEVDPRITCVLDDRAGFLWLGTLGGICRVEKAMLLGAPSAVTKSALVLDRSDGLMTRECTGGGQPAGWRGHDGALYFSTGRGVARVYPERLVLNGHAPPVVIEEASAGGHPLAQIAERVQAGPGRSRLEFRYTALTFTAPEKVRFRTQLEGLDETWRDTDGQRMAAYEAVPPGRYRFRVMAENGDGVWNEAGAALAVEVRPHFWETLWFQAAAALLAAAVAVGVGALIMRARLRGRLLRLEAKNAREAERARIAQDLHDDLGASLTEISLLADLAAEERQEAGGEDDTLPEIAATAQNLVGALDEIVWAANPRHDTLRSLAEYLTSFAAKFLGRAKITLRRDVPRDLPERSLDAKRRHSIFLAVREALNNAVKHSGASEVWLRLRLDNDRIEVAIEDNGRGFDPQASGEGDGVGNLASRLERLGGRGRIESRSGGGTRVLLTLPAN